MGYGLGVAWLQVERVEDVVVAPYEEDYSSVGDALVYRVHVVDLHRELEQQINLGGKASEQSVIVESPYVLRAEKSLKVSIEGSFD